MMLPGAVAHSLELQHLVSRGRQVSGLQDSKSYRETQCPNQKWALIQHKRDPHKLEIWMETHTQKNTKQNKTWILASIKILKQ